MFLCPEIATIYWHLTLLEYHCMYTESCELLQRIWLAEGHMTRTLKKTFNTIGISRFHYLVTFSNKPDIDTYLLFALCLLTVLHIPLAKEVLLELCSVIVSQIFSFWPYKVIQWCKFTVYVHVECIKLDIMLGLVLKLLVCASVSFGELSGRKEGREERGRQYVSVWIRL